MRSWKEDNMENGHAMPLTEKKSVPKGLFYTHGRFGRGYRETLDTNSPYLYASGHRLSKYTKDDMPPWYCPIHCRSISYMQGYVKCKGVTDIGYTFHKENHLFKDDYIYLKYGGRLEETYSEWGYRSYSNYDLCIDGNDILDIILYVEHFCPEVDTTRVRQLIKEKVFYLCKEEPHYYEGVFHTKKLVDVFEYYKDYLPKF